MFFLPGALISLWGNFHGIHSRSKTVNINYAIVSTMLREIPLILRAVLSLMPAVLVLYICLNDS